MRGWLIAVTAANAYSCAVAPAEELLLVPAPLSCGAGDPGARPNFVVILTDDLDQPSAAVMPRVTTELAARGLTFEQAFATYGSCCPSRASLFTGQYPHNHGILSNSPPQGGFTVFRDSGRENSTLATWLRDAGYKTVLIGKYLNGYPAPFDLGYVPPGWDEWYALGPGRYFNYTLIENGAERAYGQAPHDYETDVLAQHALEFLERAEQDDRRPFFLWFAPQAPHGPSTPAPRHASEFRDVLAPRPPSFNELDMRDKPAVMRGLPLLAVRDTQWIDHRHRQRLQTLLAVDEAVGRLLDRLAALCELESTYLIFTSDNGWHMGQHRMLSGKATAYEEDLHVPLFVRGPGVPEGASRVHLALNIDLAPTLAELASVDAPELIDGRSLAPLFRAEPPPLSAWRRDFVVQHAAAAIGDDEDTPPGTTLFALRTERFKLIDHANPSGERELYDLEADPFELENRAGTGHAMEQVLDARLSSMKTCRGAECRR